MNKELTAEDLKAERERGFWQGAKDAKDGKVMSLRFDEPKNWWDGYRDGYFSKKVERF